MANQYFELNNQKPFAKKLAILVRDSNKNINLAINLKNVANELNHWRNHT